MKCRNNSLSSLFSFPCRDVSRSSSVLERGIGILAEKTPLGDVWLASLTAGKLGAVALCRV